MPTAEPRTACAFCPYDLQRSSPWSDHNAEEHDLARRVSHARDGLTPAAPLPRRDEDGDVGCDGALHGPHRSLGAQNARTRNS